VTLANGSVRGDARGLMHKALFRAAYSITRLTEDERRYMTASYESDLYLSENAAEVLRLDSPRLRQLRGACLALDLPMCEHNVCGEA
jgi:hypothetical protein